MSWPNNFPNTCIFRMFQMFVCEQAILANTLQGQQQQKVMEPKNFIQQTRVANRKLCELGQTLTVDDLSGGLDDGKILLGDS